MSYWAAFSLCICAFAIADYAVLVADRRRKNNVLPAIFVAATVTWCGGNAIEAIAERFHRPPVAAEQGREGGGE